MSEQAVRTYYRKASSTQTLATALLQRASGEIWGAVPLGGWEPVVQAYQGPLPAGVDGIEFTTDVPMEPGQNRRSASWRAPATRVIWHNDKEYAVLAGVTVTKIVHNGQEV